MGKHVKRTLEEKIKIVKEYKEGASLTYLCEKYNISGTGTISTWSKKYDEGTLGIDNRGKRKSLEEIEDIDILKKSYAALMEIRKARQE